MTADHIARHLMPRRERQWRVQRAHRRESSVTSVSCRSGWRRPLVPRLGSPLCAPSLLALAHWRLMQKVRERGTGLLGRRRSGGVIPDRYPDDAIPDRLL